MSLNSAPPSGPRIVSPWSQPAADQPSTDQASSLREHFYPANSSIPKPPSQLPLSPGEERRFQSLDALKAAAEIELRRRATTSALNREKLSNYHDYTRAIWPLVESRPFIDNWHIGAIGECVDAVLLGQILGLIINQPPRFMKSLNVGVSLPTYAWTKKPELQFLSACYAYPLAVRDAVKSRRIIESEWYRARWGNTVILSEDQNQKHRYENTRRGHRIATSVGGIGVGEGGDIKIIDDPLKPDEASSDIGRESVIDWWSETWHLRSNSDETADIITHQRLHDRDLTGYVLEELLGYVHLCIPMRFEEDRRCSIIVIKPLPGLKPLSAQEFFAIAESIKAEALPPEASTHQAEAPSSVGPLPEADYENDEEIREFGESFEPSSSPGLDGLNNTERMAATIRYLAQQPKQTLDKFNLVKIFEDPRQVEGELAWPERFNEAYVQRAEAALGSFAASGQLQQNPYPKGGGHVKELWWGYWQYPGQSLPPVVVKDEEGNLHEIYPVDLPPLKSFVKLAQFWDTSFKDERKSDFVAGGIIGSHGTADRYILDAVTRRMGIRGVIGQILKWDKEYPKARGKYIEDAANGPAIVQLMRRKVSGLILVTPKELGGSKLARVIACEPEIESRNVFLPHPSVKPITKKIIKQFNQFPKGARDDLVDFTTMGLIKLNGVRNNIHISNKN